MHENNIEDEDQEKEMTEEEMRERVIRLAFGGDLHQYDEFCKILRAELPGGTSAVLRGSAVTGVRWDDGAPFDADGPGTSDLDLTLVGDKVHDFYILDGYYLPGIHTKPLSDKDPDIAPKLTALRDKLQSMVRRPVNIQATRDFVMYVRENIFGQPYLTLFEKASES
jgi:hypothetical protein